ncbi:hypothetical protein DL93DRAFT_2078454 [Clavulina sp. PMI_390]|nr:hypothetical protein DL93DRAFT_2078454 [Clavulina sp. PMI_390]
METGGDITLASLCQQAIRSAELWEMPKLRMVILSHITQKCNPLKEVPLEKVISSPLPNAIVSEEQVASAIHALHFVLRVPPEYLDKATRAGVGHTALICDIFRCRHVDAAGKAKAIEDSVALRTLLCRLAEEFSNIEALITNASIITHLSTPLAQISSSNPNPKEAVSPSSTAASAQGLQAISLKLLELAYSSTVDSFKQDGDVTLLRHILGHSHQVLSSGLVLKTKERKSFSFGFESRAAMVLLSSLAGALQTSSNSVDISEECRQLFQLLQGQVNSGLATLSSNPDSVAPETSIAVIVAAEKLLRVESWLGEPPLHGEGDIQTMYATCALTFHHICENSWRCVVVEGPRWHLAH